MKNVFKVLGVIALVAVIGFGLVSCGGDDDGGTTGGGTVAVTGVTLNKTTLSLVVNGTEKLTATVAPDNATNKAVTWSSSEFSTAIVAEDGTVTAKASGTANITVTTADGHFFATCVVTVTPPPVQIPTTGVTTLTIDTWTRCSALQDAGDVQWFKFDATASTQYVHGAGRAGQNGNFQLYDSNGVPVGNEEYLGFQSSTTVQNFSRSLTVGSTYYIRVRGRYPIDVGFSDSTALF